MKPPWAPEIPVPFTLDHKVIISRMKDGSILKRCRTCGRPAGELEKTTHVRRGASDA